MTYRALIGWGLVALGILGTLLPIMPGIVFLVPGLLVLSGESRFLRRHMLRLWRRHPKLVRRLRLPTLERLRRKKAPRPSRMPRPGAPEV